MTATAIAFMRSYERDGTNRAKVMHKKLMGKAGGQFNSFVEISTDFSTDISTEFLVLQGVPHYYKSFVEKTVEKSVEI